MAVINRDEWLAAVKAANEAPIPESDAISVNEFAEIVGIERSFASKRLKRMVDAGLAERTKKAARRADGGLIWIPAYRLVKQEVAHGDARPDARRPVGPRPGARSK